MVHLSEVAAEALDQAYSPCHRLQQRSLPHHSSKMHAAASESPGAQRAFRQALPGQKQAPGAQSYPGQHQGTRSVPMQERAPPHAWACCTGTPAHQCCQCHASDLLGPKVATAANLQAVCVWYNVWFHLVHSSRHTALGLSLNIDRLRQYSL